jgi:H+/gluconate symporter-like permease
MPEKESGRSVNDVKEAAHGNDVRHDSGGGGGKPVTGLLTKPFLDGGIAVICLMLTILFDFGMAVFGNPAKLAELKADHSKFIEFLDKPFDLWAIGFALIVGAVVGREGNQKERLLAPCIAAAITLILIVASVGVAIVFESEKIRILAPDLLGVGFVGYTLNRMRA